MQPTCLSRLIKVQLITYMPSDAGIVTSTKVEDAMKAVDRAVFVPDKEISGCLRYIY